MMSRRSFAPAVLLMLAACRGGGTDPEPVASVSVTAPAQSLIIGRTLQLSASVLGPSGTTLSGRAITWSSSNAALASVTPGGLVTAIGEGAVTISAAAEGHTAGVDLSTKYPFPNVAGTYTLTSSFEGLADRGPVGTVRFTQADRMQGAVSATSSLTMLVQGVVGTLNPLINVQVDTTGQVSFEVRSETPTASWKFVGMLTGSTIAGRHVQTTSAFIIGGPFTMVRGGSAVMASRTPAAARAVGIEDVSRALRSAR